MTTQLLILFSIGLALSLLAFVFRSQPTLRNVLAILGGTFMLIPLMIIGYFLFIIFTA